MFDVIENIYYGKAREKAIVQGLDVQRWFRKKFLLSFDGELEIFYNNKVYGHKHSYRLLFAPDTLSRQPIRWYERVKFTYPDDLTPYQIAKILKENNIITKGITYINYNQPFIKIENILFRIWGNLYPVSVWGIEWNGEIPQNPFEILKEISPLQIVKIQDLFSEKSMKDFIILLFFLFNTNVRYGKIYPMLWDYYEKTFNKEG